MYFYEPGAEMCLTGDLFGSLHQLILDSNLLRSMKGKCDGQVSYFKSLWIYLVFGSRGSAVRPMVVYISGYSEHNV